MVQTLSNMRLPFPNSIALITLSLLFSAALAACKEDNPTAGKHTLQSAKAAWAAQPKASYTIDQSWSCECLQTQHGDVRITVQENRITRVMRLADGQPVPEDQWQLFDTVDELFARAEDFGTKTPFQSEVQYDPEHGYPTVLTVDYSAQTADDEFSVRTGGLSF